MAAAARPSNPRGVTPIRHVVIIPADNPPLLRIKPPGSPEHRTLSTALQDDDRIRDQVGATGLAAFVLLVDRNSPPWVITMPAPESQQPRNLRRLDFPGKRICVVLLAAFTTACHKSSPTAPTPPPPTPSANVAITSISTAGGHAATAGFVYRTVIHLRETAGTPATITSVDLTFMDGTNVIMSSHHDDPIPATANVCPASGAVDTKELMTVDADAGHPYATALQATITYTDATATARVANGSSGVPPLAEPPTPQTYSLAGIVSDETGHGIASARVEVLNGANAGVVSTTDVAGAYVMARLLPDSFRLRASADGYDSGEQGVTVPANPRADFTLRRRVDSCAYTITPAGILEAPQPGGQFNVAITRTSGSCGWQATADVGWISLARVNGNGSDTLAYTVAPNANFVGRIGVIRIAWAGGSAQLTVRQANDWPAFCVGTITVEGQSSIVVPAGGGQFTALIAAVPGMPPGLCDGWTATVNGPITFVGSSTGRTPGQLTFVVPPNAAVQPRVLWVSIKWDSPSGGNAQLTVNQSGTP
jgi:hypothetical protein